MRRPGALALALPAAAGLGMLFYTYLTPPLLNEAWLARLPWLGGLPGDLPVYGLRFLASFALLGVWPFAAALALGERPASLGLGRPRWLSPGWLFPLLLVVVAAGGLIGAYNRPIYAYYPYSRTLTESSPGGIGGFGLHAVLYLALYYVPWEVLFRGILIFPLVRLAAGGPFDPRALPRSVLAVAFLQALPATLLHFGHPWSETLIALPFGLLLGWLAVRTGSVWPGLALHAGAGLFLDLFILLRRAGALP